MRGGMSEKDSMTKSLYLFILKPQERELNYLTIFISKMRWMTVWLTMGELGNICLNNAVPATSTAPSSSPEKDLVLYAHKLMKFYDFASFTSHVFIKLY